jgi:lipopolysaccharide O-acetyltransferase
MHTQPFLPTIERGSDAATVGTRRAEHITAAELPPASLLSRSARRGRRAVSHWLWRRRLNALGPKSYIDWPAWVVGGSSIAVGAQVAVWHHARLEAFNAQPAVIRLSIGDLTTIQPYAHIGAAESVRIGRGVAIASSVYISDHDHDWCDPGEPAIFNERLRTAAVEIGDFVWLGERAIVLKGVTIGAYSVIGAGSIVTRDVPPYTLAVGAPARVIRRYDHERRLWTPVKQ